MIIFQLSLSVFNGFLFRKALTGLIAGVYTYLLDILVCSHLFRKKKKEKKPEINKRENKKYEKATKK